MSEVCPKCKGQKFNPIHLNYGTHDRRSGWYRRPCRWCEGKGTVDQAVLDRIAEGARRRADRKARGVEAQAEAERLGISFDELIAAEIGLPEGSKYFDDWQPGEESRVCANPPPPSGPPPPDAERRSKHPSAEADGFSRPD